MVEEGQDAFVYIARDALSLSNKTRCRHPWLCHGTRTQRIPNFRTDTADTEPSGAALPLANARGARRLGVRSHTADSETVGLGRNISTAGNNISTMSREFSGDFLSKAVHIVF